MGSRNGVEDPNAVLKLLALVERLCEESRPGRAVPVRISSSLERDLGLDSLARVELLTRVEQEFGVKLGEDTLVNAETPRTCWRRSTPRAREYRRLRGLRRALRSHRPR